MRRGRRCRSLEDGPRADLDSDRTLAIVLTHLLEMLGEAAKHVSPATRARYPGLPWQDIGGTRDRLIHGYYDVDLDIIWNIVERNLPPLIDDLEATLPPASGDPQTEA